jgi:prepilin-type processing-associated H-X9-DG protein
VAQEAPARDVVENRAVQTHTGVATGKAHAPVFDAKSRPITAGEFVDGAPTVFTDATKQSRLDQFRHRMGTSAKSKILDANGSGVALIDYDNDGWMDIYLLNGSTFAAVQGKEKAPRAMLFHNNHDGTFTDVTDKAGVANERWGFGVAVGDYDNDGWPYLYVANYGKNRLYHNNGDGTFTDRAEQGGVTLGGRSTGPAWGDYDRDGRLDLTIEEETLAPKHPEVAATLGNLAMVLFADGHLDEARSLFQRALAIMEKALGPNRPGVAAMLGKLAMVLNAEGHPDEACKLLQRALSIKRSFSASDPGIGGS